MDQTVLLSVDRKIQHCAKAPAEKERAVEDEKAVNQTTMTAHGTF